MSTAASGPARAPRLILRFALYSAIALLLAGGGIFWFIRHQEQTQAEQGVVARASRVAARVAEEVRPSDLREPVSGDRLAALDRLFRSEVTDGLVRVKLWSRDGKLVYSNEHALIGRDTNEPHQLEDALRGKSGSEVTSLDDEHAADAQLKVLEAFVPVRLPGEKTTTGALELYHEYGPIAANVRSAMTPIGIALGLAWILLYAALFPILRQVTKALEQRNESLAEQAEAYRRSLEERGEAERRLSEAERNYRNLVEQLPLVTYINRLDETSSAIYMSPQIEDLLGYPVTALLSDPEFFPKALHPDDRERILALHRDSYAAGRSFSAEYRLLARDGRVVWVRDEVMIAKDRQGRPLHAQGFLVDITERKQAENALREKTAFVELLQAIAIAANESATVDEAMQVCLDRVCAHTGWPVGHVYLAAGESDSELVPTSIWHLNDPHEFEAFREVTEATSFSPGVGLPGRALASGTPLWIMDVSKDSNFPRAKWAEEVGLRAGFAFPVLAGAEVVAVLEFFSTEAVQPDAALLDVMGHIGTQLGRVVERTRAVGALRESEEHHRSVIETANDAFVAIDESGTITDWNGQAELTFGWTREEAIGRSLKETIIPAEYREAHQRGLERFLATGEETVLFKPIELSALHRDGREFPAELKIWSVQAGETHQFNAFVQDITERKRAEAEREELLATLAAHNERLLELDRLKDEFIALVSHELRTPLTSIRGYVELLRDGEAGNLNDEQQQFLGVVERNSHRLLHLVGDLLFLAQVEAGKLTLEMGAVDLGATASESVEAARPLAEEKDVTLTLATGPTPLLVGDRARLAQLFDNLVSNAIKFTPAGGRVDVRVRTIEGDAVVEVRDSGIGIPAAEQQQLFQRFFRTSNATAQAIQGTGLGLAISKAIVDAHGGRIAVASREDEGTTFRVNLPMAQQAVEPEQAVAL